MSNVISLQQNLISFSSIHIKERENDLEKCKKYLQLLKWNGPMVLEFLSKNQGIFTFEEYKSAIELIYQSNSPLAKQRSNTALNKIPNDTAVAVTGTSAVQENAFVKEGKETLFLLKDYFINHRM